MTWTNLATFAAFLGFAFATAAAPASSSQAPSSCPLTKPPSNAYVPPTPYSSTAGPGQYWIGNDNLWTYLPFSGSWTLGHYSPEEPALRQKLLWYRKGYNPRTEPKPNLIITGKRLDAPAPPMSIDGPHGAWLSSDPTQTFMTSAFNLPAAGCWEITGQYEKDKLTFVVWVHESHATLSQSTR